MPTPVVRFGVLHEQVLLIQILVTRQRRAVQPCMDHDDTVYYHPGARLVAHVEPSRYHTEQVLRPNRNTRQKLLNHLQILQDLLVQDDVDQIHHIGEAIVHHVKTHNTP